jgi:cytochrome c5
MLNNIKYHIAVIKIIPLFVLLIVAVSCSKRTTGSKSVEKPPAEMQPLAPTPAPNQEMPRDPVKEVTNSEEEKKKIALMAAGKEAFSVKCSKCHELFDPSKFNEAKWEKVIDWMGPRAKLEVQEKEAILAYVKHNAKK